MNVLTKMEFLKIIVQELNNVYLKYYLNIKVCLSVHSLVCAYVTVHHFITLIAKSNKMSLTKYAVYVSGVKKNYLGSPSNP